MNPSSLGQRIAFYRKKAGIHQTDLAAAIGLSHNAISNYERNQRVPDISTLLKIAKALNVTADTLLGLESPENAGESNILRVYRNLNGSGQDQMLEYAAYLEENPKYRDNSSLLA